MFKAHKAALEQRDQQSFAQLLSYAFLWDSATVLHKDGAFSAHFAYVAEDVDSSTSDILDGNARAVKQAIATLDDGWMLETNLVSEPDQRYLVPTDFPDPVSQLIDDARRFRFESENNLFKSTCYLSLTQAPVDIIAQKLSRALSEGGQKEEAIEERARKFEAGVSSFLTHFEKITRSAEEENLNSDLNGLNISRIHRLTDEHLISFLHNTITGDARGLKAPKVGYFLDAYLSEKEFIGGTLPKIGNQYVKVISLDDIPERTYPAILDVLNYLPIHYRWASRFVFLSKPKVRGYLKKLRRNWSNKAIGLWGVILASAGGAVKLREDAQYRKEQVEGSIFANDNGDTNFGFMTSTIVVMDEDANTVNQYAQTIVKLINSLEYKAREESINASMAYLGSIPGHGCYNIRKPLVDSDYLSHALPTSSVWRGSASCPSPKFAKHSPALACVKTQGSRTFRLNTYVSDIGHSCIIGPTGSGKTTLIQFIKSQFLRYPNARVIEFDKDRSNACSTLLLGGQCFDLGGGVSLSPFARLAQFSESDAQGNDDANFQVEFDYCITWLSEICTLRGVNVSAAKEKEIRKTLGDLVQAGREGLTLDLVASGIQDPDIRMAIEQFNTGSVAHMLSGTTNPFDASALLNFSVDRLLELNEASWRPVIDLLLHNLKSFFCTDIRPTLLILEEAWNLVNNPVFLAQINDWLRTLRKYNVSVFFVSQTVSDIAAHEFSTLLRESCPTKIFLPNHQMDEKTQEGYQALGLNQQQTLLIRDATPKQDYYLCSPAGNRLFNLDLGPLELSFLSKSMQDYPAISQLVKEDNWLKTHLLNHNLEDWWNYVKANTP